MNKLTDRPPMSRTDKLCLAALAGILVTVTVYYEMTEGAAIRAAEADKPPAEVVAVAPPIDCIRLAEAVEAMRAEQYNETIPLDWELQEVLRTACEKYGVPVHLALGLMEVESQFQPEADNGLCYGLMQLNKRYYPDGLSPAENIQAGVAYLGKLSSQYEDTAAALTAYNAGHDTGSRTYANAVLAAAERWED